MVDKGILLKSLNNYSCMIKDNHLSKCTIFKLNVVTFGKEKQL